MDKRFTAAVLAKFLTKAQPNKKNQECFWIKLPIHRKIYAIPEKEIQFI